MRFETVKIRDIEPITDPVELDEALTASIAKIGVMQPIDIRELNGKYRMMDGRRRLKAAVSLGLETIPATVHVLTDLQEAEMLIMQ